jgi:hypothetical protein
MPKLYNLGTYNLISYQRRLGGNHKIAAASVNLGSTRGKGSSTRILNFCNKRVSNGTCLNQFIHQQ